MGERICVVGCGAIGGLYAAHLARLTELEVWAFDVSAEHVAAIRRDGLRLTGAVTLTATVHARTDPAEIPPCRFGIVATKGPFTASASAASAAVFADAAVCSVQNGIGNEEVIARHAPRVMRGVTLPAGHLTAPGVVEVAALGPTWIGPFEPAPASAAEVTQLAGWLTAAGLQTIAGVDVRGPQWTKLLFNSATNPLCALTGLTHGELVDHPPTRALAAALVAEGEAVAAASGITLDGDPVKLIDAAARANHQHRPSMLQDVAARRATEIETLNGGIVTAGAACGVATPLHEAVRAMTRGLEHSWSSRHLWTNKQTVCNNTVMHGAQKIDWGQQSFTEARPGIFGATVHTPQLTAILYRYGAGTSWEEHQHPQDQITTVLSGAIDFVVDGTPLRLSAGELATLPGGTPHSATVSQPAVSLNVLTHRNAPPSPSA